MADELRPCATHPRHLAHGRCSVCSTDLCKSCLRESGGHVLCLGCLRAVDDHDDDHVRDELRPASSWPDDYPPEDRAPEDHPATDLTTDLTAEGFVPEPATAPPRPPRVRMPASVYLMLVTQAATIAVLAGALWRAGALPFTDLDRPAAAGPTVIALDPPRRAGDGRSLVVAGHAPDAAFATLVIDDEVTAVELIHDARFRFAAIEITAATAHVRVIAYDRAGASVESAPIWLALTPTEPTPALTLATPSPAATTAPPGITTELARSTPAPVHRRRPRNILRGSREQHIALTFDGGSHASQALLVLDTLRNKGVRSTIFLTGEFISSYPNVTRRIVADGHEVGNHTVDHLHLADWVDGRRHVTRPEVSRTILVGQLDETARRFEATTGRSMISYWRAPFGEINPEILRWAEEAGWVHVGWTQGLDTLDWVADPDDSLYRSATEIRERILTAARSGPARGGIVLMHLGADRSDPPAIELPRIIDGLREAGYRLVTVSTLVGS